MKSERELFEPADEDTFNVYTEYRRGMPRFRFRENSAACVVLFPDESLDSGGMVDNILPQSLHQQDSEYSLELLDLIPENRITSLPVPFLGPLLFSYCRKYTVMQDDIAAMAVEGLIDGMNLDEFWCTRNLTNIEPKDLDHVLSRIRGKTSRIDYFSPNSVTCIITNDEEAQRLLRVPGREVPALPRNKPSQNLVNYLWNMTADVCNDHWMKFVRRFLDCQNQNLPHTL